MFAPDVPGILGAAAKRFPGREAAVSGRDRVTYASAARTGLPGGGWPAAPWPACRIPVAVLADNSLAYLELYFAVPAAGMVLLPLNTRLAEPEIKRDPDRSGHGVAARWTGYEHIAAEVASAARSG